MERVQQLCRELRAQHVALPERAVAAALAAWRAAPAAPPAPAACGEFVTRANRARESVAALRAQLRAPPLGGRDYDDFPLQEDALGAVRAGAEAAGAALDAAEQLFARVPRPAPAQARRVRDKLRDEWAALQRALAARRDRCASFVFPSPK